MASEVEHDSELLWLAFRYVAGEMSLDETESFERRLDGDQEAREAVARAVELTGAVAAVRSGSIPTFTLPRRRRLVRVIVGVAALAAAACLAWLVVTPHAGERLAVTPKVSPSATVTLAWSTLRQEREGEKDETTALLAANDDLPALSESDDSADAGLPLWLLDAASLAGRPNHAAPPAKEL
jgi:ferric-dicitrate binding protein FerR (iron transport regulator)